MSAAAWPRQGRLPAAWSGESQGEAMAVLAPADRRSRTGITEQTTPQMLNESRGTAPMKAAVDPGRPSGTWGAVCNYVIITVAQPRPVGRTGIGMGNDQDAAAAGTTAGGTGRLAQVIATRGGLAAPEAPFVIEHREALIYMLCEAAELEHGIMCQYLFAAFSLKQSADEGLTEAELAAVTRWRKQISHVATQEMLHLALVHNLLSAIGAAPHLARPNFPAPASHYPAGVQLTLLPFGEEALQHFMFLERPEGMDIGDAEGIQAVGRAAPVVNERDIVPQGQDFATVGHLYRSIEHGFARLTAKYGERWLFTGPPRAQATEPHFRWPELIAVTDLASACRAIEEILEQGEGPRGDWRDAHFGQFVAILDEYQQMRAE